jgi:hypothetical protein
MFAGYSDVKATTTVGTPIREEDMEREDGPVMTLQFPGIELVRVDIHAALRIVKHARDSGSRMVMGSLVGMQIGTVAEVTNAVPFVQSPDADDEGKKDRADHMELKRRLSQCGLDSFAVGRYTCSAHSMHLSSRNLTHLENLVRNGEPSVIVAYDPLRSAMGKLYLKAFVLSDEYLAIVREDMTLANHPDSEAMEERRRPKKIEGGLVKEIPVEIYASSLQQQLLGSLAEKPRNVQNSVIAHHDLGRYTERALATANDVLEKLRSDVTFRQVRHRGDEGVAALRSDTHMLAQQLKDQALHINAIAAGSVLNLDFARKITAEQRDE